MNDTTTTTASTTETIVDTYLDAYGEADPARRRTLIERSWSPTGTLADPPFDAAGHDALDATFAAVQGQFPGHRFRRTSAVDSHHGFARYSWDLMAPDGSVPVAGTDFAHVVDGLIVNVAGFFGPLPERESGPDRADC
jgi:hypothetical protein